MYPGLSSANWLTIHGLVTAAAVLLYVSTSHVMRQRRNPSSAIAWMLFILLLPYVALPAYWTFGSRKRPRAIPSSRTPAPPAGPDEGWAIQTARALCQPPPVTFFDLMVHRDGREAWDGLLATIDGAQRSIDLCTFLLKRDDIGNAVVDRLCDKARQGVRVRLLIDGWGRLMARPPQLKRLSAAGGKVALFMAPFGSPLRVRTNLRDHRKLLIADAESDSGRLWCGGRNLASEYFEGEPGVPAWHDLTFDLKGQLVRQASALFERDWAFAMGRAVDGGSPAGAELHGPATGAQLLASGPDQADDTVYTLLVTAAYRAQVSVVLVTPYFVPDTALLAALCLAARRGVAVDLLVPSRSNHPLSDLVRDRALRVMVDAGARVWLAPGMLHAKLVVVDDVLAMVGSANLDTRSLFLNYELMVAFHGAGDVRRFTAWFDAERLTASRYVARTPGLIRDVWEGMLLWLGFQL